MPPPPSRYERFLEVLRGLVDRVPAVHTDVGGRLRQGIDRVLDAPAQAVVQAVPEVPTTAGAQARGFIDEHLPGGPTTSANDEAQLRAFMLNQQAVK